MINAAAELVDTTPLSNRYSVRALLGISQRVLIIGW
jgi:hypothetical protein